MWDDLNMDFIAKLMKKLGDWIQYFLDKCTWIKTSPTILISLMQFSCSNASEGSIVLRNFTNDFAQEISNEYGLRLSGSGASFPVKLEYVSLDFKANYPENVSGARRLAVEITHKMIKKINQDLNLQKYLANTPASLKNVCLTIAFSESSAVKDKRSLNSIMVLGPRDKVVFNILDESEKMLIPLQRETFAEAEKIVMQEGSTSNTGNEPSSSN